MPVNEEDGMVMGEDDTISRLCLLAELTVVCGGGPRLKQWVCSSVTGGKIVAVWVDLVS